ncbi:cobamide remodeling phosphodiesterase CbiR [Desulfatitalea alkaliphila]|uniref:TIM barrel protein n=1 Tax=Desulfatitalea alkaliphila TaxID=2929485 RepID=A0AA41R481_9BACT|nr:cobamide remodeling phosphodiesterase CbiR [Desulfatitalea alkaliphila]MCJ8500770.1 TIM barrel protein [Desulfatitalea alkaliphila]
MTYPRLPLAYKDRFSFRLSAPSFIYPADYATNARRLAPFIDEIELLLFESDPNALPSAAEIEQLAAIGNETGVTYNVHLPIDADMTVTDAVTRRTAGDRLATVIERVRPLRPTTHTVHLNRHPLDNRRPQDPLAVWQADVTALMKGLMERTGLAPRALSVETLDYPPEWFAPVCEALDLAVCIDLGHLLRYGFDPQTVWRRFDGRITIVHLHGVHDGRDHLGLDALPAPQLMELARLLRRFEGTVSLEVFAFERLKVSLELLTETMDRINAAGCVRR